MGIIEDDKKKKERLRRKRSNNDPLSKGIGNRDIETNDFDIDEPTIRDQKNKK